MTEYRRRRLLYLVRRVLRGYELEPKERREVARLRLHTKDWSSTCKETWISLAPSQKSFPVMG